MRQFSSGAVRSSTKGKPDFYGYRHPIIERSYGEYMLKHQVQEDGQERKANNWWSGWDREVSLQSMIRHIEDLTALHAGYDVYKFYVNGEEKTKYLKKGTPINIPDGVVAQAVTEDDCCNAIRFNSGSYLLESLKNVD